MRGNYMNSHFICHTRTANTNTNTYTIDFRRCLRGSLLIGQRMCERVSDDKKLIEYFELWPTHNRHSLNRIQFCFSGDYFFLFFFKFVSRLSWNQTHTHDHFEQRQFFPLTDSRGPKSGSATKAQKACMNHILWSWIRNVCHLFFSFFFLSCVCAAWVSALSKRQKTVIECADTSASVVWVATRNICV